MFAHSRFFCVLFTAIAALWAAGAPPVSASQPDDPQAQDLQATDPQATVLPAELRLDGLDTIDVLVNGVPARLEVNPSVSGPIMLNPDIAEQAKLRRSEQMTYDFGEYQVPNYVARTGVDFGSGEKARRVAWTKIPASTRADGLIGVHHLPYERVTFDLGAATDGERVQRLPLKRTGSRNFVRMGTQVEVGERNVFAVFTLSVDPNYVSAGTANFLATHQEGGFVDNSEGVIEMPFGMRRPTRDMRLAYPIELGDLRIDTFAVRVKDHGKADKVGRIREDDPRFVDGAIIVSRRKRKGRPDVITRIGRKQIAHCSKLSFDMKAQEIELSCAPKPIGEASATLEP